MSSYPPCEWRHTREEQRCLLPGVASTNLYAGPFLCSWHAFCFTEGFDPLDAHFCERWWKWVCQHYPDRHDTQHYSWQILFSAAQGHRAYEDWLHSREAMFHSPEMQEPWDSQLHYFEDLKRAVGLSPIERTEERWKWEDLLREPGSDDPIAPEDEIPF